MVTEGGLEDHHPHRSFWARLDPLMIDGVLIGNSAVVTDRYNYTSHGGRSESLDRSVLRLVTCPLRI